MSRLGVGDASTKNATELAEQIARTDEARAAYLADKGKELTPEYKKKEYSKFGNEALKEYIDSVGIERIASVIADAEATSRKAFEAEKKAIIDIIRKRYVERRYNDLKNNRKLKGKDVRAFVEQQADRYIQNHVTIFSIEDFVKDAWEYYQEGSATTEEIDRLATSEKLRKSTDEKDVIAWLEPQIAEFIGEPAIYNGTDIYKSNGDRKSFAQTHYSYTAENIVRVMKQGKKRGEGTFGANANSVIATAIPSYKSVSDIHADDSRLQIEDQGKYDAILNDLENSLRSIEDDILRTTKHTADNTFEETQTIGGIITDAALGARTVPAIQKEFLRYGYSITQAQAKKILDLYKSAANVPTGYFESKPERVVEFSEIQMVELPNNASEHLKAELDKRGIPYELYGNTDEERTEAVKRLDHVRFDLSEDRGYSRGQTAKIVANATKSKVYSKAEAEAAIDNVTALVSDLTSEVNVLRKADIRGKSRAEVIDYLWERMNAAQEKDRLNAALNTAEYLINHAIVKEEYDGYGADGKRKRPCSRPPPAAHRAARRLVKNKVSSNAPQPKRPRNTEQGTEQERNKETR